MFKNDNILLQGGGLNLNTGPESIYVPIVIEMSGWIWNTSCLRMESSHVSLLKNYKHTPKQKTKKGVGVKGVTWLAGGSKNNILFIMKYLLLKWSIFHYLYPHFSSTFHYDSKVLVWLKKDTKLSIEFAFTIFGFYSADFLSLSLFSSKSKFWRKTVSTLRSMTLQLIKSNTSPSQG